jgi:hypothetical protein
MTAGSPYCVGTGVDERSNVTRPQRQGRITGKIVSRQSSRSLGRNARRHDRRFSPIVRTSVLAGPSLSLVLSFNERIFA